MGSDAILVKGFIASLLQQGDDWDIRCLQADMSDYHQQQYSRMDPTIALEQELRWWLESLINKKKTSFRAGLLDLIWC